MVEFVPTRQRAVMILTLQLFYGLGAAFAASVALLTMPILGWRGMTFFCALPMIIYIIVAFVCSSLLVSLLCCAILCLLALDAFMLWIWNTD